MPKRKSSAFHLFAAIALAGVVALCPARLSAGIIVVSDFESGSDPLNIDPASNLTTTDFSIATGTYKAHSSSEPAKGNRGFSLKIEHLSTSDVFYVISFSPVDLRGYRTLSFWIRGESGGEDFKLDLRRVTSPSEPSFRPNIKEFMVGGISTDWKKVNIPLKAIFKELLTEDYEALSDVNGIVLNFTGSTPAEVVYIDDVIFHSKSGNVMVDNFDDGSDPMAFGHNPFDFINGGAGASFIRTYDSANALGGSGNALKVAWSTGSSLPTAAVTAIVIDTRAFAANKIGVDVSGSDVLSFQVKGEASANGKLLGLGLADDTGSESIHASSVTMTTSYQQIKLSMAGFSINVDSVSVFELWLINDSEGRGPPIDTITSATFYIDNIQFLDTSTPTVPTTLLKNGEALANGALFVSTDVLSVTADAESTDATLERIRFEHDNLTGGVNWYVIGVDTDTADTAYSASWEDFSSLLPGNTYQVRAVAEDIAGNEGQMTSFTGITVTPSTPSLAGFQMFTTSLSVILSGNGNPTGTTLEITTGSFEATNSSSSLSDVGNSTLTISNLVSNRIYSINARAVGVNGVAGLTVPVNLSTSTLAAVPGAFTVFASTNFGISSMSVTWGGNGNSLTPPTSYQMEVSTSSDFVLASTSITFLTEGSSDTLDSNTTYFFRAAAFGVGGGSTAFNAVVSTVTLPTPPSSSATVSGFNSITLVITTASNSGTGRHNVQLSTASAFGGPGVAVVSATGTLSIAATTFAGLLDGASYFVRTRTLWNGQSDGQDQNASAYVTFTTATLPVLPSLTLVSVGASSFTVSLERGGNNDNGPYEISFSTNSDFNSFVTTSAIGVLPSGNTSFADLIGNATYFIRARALWNSAGDNLLLNASGYSAIISTLVLQGANSPGVVNFQIFTTSVSVTLAPNGNPAGTTVSITTGSFEAGSSSSAVLDAGNVTLVISTMGPNRTYTIQTRAVSVNNLVSTDTVVASTATLPEVPGGITFGAVTSTSISVSWSGNENPLSPPTSYQVQVSSGQDSSFAAFSTSDTFALTMTTATLSQLTTYFFRIFSFGVGGSTSGFSAAASIVTAEFIPTAPSTPTGLTVTSIETDSITFAWADNSSDEDGFRILNSTLGILHHLTPNQTGIQLTGLTPDTLIKSSGIAAFNSVGASTGAASISSHTLANSPGTPSFVRMTRSQVSIQWSTNSNPSTVFYEITQSTDNFSFSPGISTPVTFSSNLTSTSTTFGGLSPMTTYYFRVRSSNRDSVPSAFSIIISSLTPVIEVILSTGGAIDAGGTTVTADPGVTVTLTTLSDGTTQQTLLSTETATVSYGNGFDLELTAGLIATVIASGNSLRVTSTGTVPIVNAGVTIELASGTLTVQSTGEMLSVILATDAPQNVVAAIPTSGERTIAITLNPLSGPIKTSLPPGALPLDVRVRVKLPDSFPVAAALRAVPRLSPSPGLALRSGIPLGVPSILDGFGIGVEITLDQNVLPVKTITISVAYRDSDISGTETETLVVARFEESVRKWITLPTSVDEPARSATGSTNRFSKFQLMALAPASNVDQPKVFPNPLRPHLGHSEMTFTNLSVHAGVKIYTYAGELVRSLTADATGTARWDGTNLLGEKVGSGVYFALIEGGEDSRRVLKVVVER